MMTLLQRELLGASRDPVFLVSRWIAALGGMALLGALASLVEAPLGQIGLHVARMFHLVMCVGLLAAGAWVGAPALMRERMDGTLPLLLLTRLTPASVVLGKALGAVLRLAATWLAAVPAGMVPLVLGAVRWQDTVAYLMFEAAMGATGLAAGLMASAMVRRPSEWVGTTVTLTLTGGALVGGTILGIFAMLRRPPPWLWPVLGTAYALAVLAVLVLRVLPWIALVLVARSTEEETQDEPPAFADDEDVERVEERAWRWHWRRGDGARVRGRNPLRWLWLREPGRIPTWWLWVGVLVLSWAVSAALERRVDPAHDMRRWGVELAGWTVLAAMGVAASRGYRRELSSGAMELLLTTALTDGAFIRRDAWILATRFGAPLATHGLLAWAAWRTNQAWVWPERMAWVAMSPWLASWVGLSMSGLMRGPWSATFATMAALAAPWCVAWVLDQELGLRRAWGSVAVLGGCLVLAGGFRAWLWQSWRTREFVARQLAPGVPR
ncbi:MAG: hypothetical protein WCR07_15495 [Verrucomicrobiota bacterium]|jgi:hypothetical protein